MRAAEFQKRIADLVFSAREHMKALQKEQDDSEEDFEAWKNSEPDEDAMDPDNSDNGPDVIDNSEKIAHIETAIGHLEAAVDELDGALDD